MWTAKDIKNQKGKTIIVTGANIGLGYETALALYKAGAHVVLACRDNARAEEAANKMKAEGGAGSLEIAILDLSDLAQIEQFATDFKRNHDRLDVLINNAGVMAPPKTFTAQGYELQIGVNFLGHFALTGHLYDLIKATPGSRIVSVSSGAFRRGAIDFSNFKAEQSYDSWREYAQSKLANMYFSFELQNRINAAGDKVLSIAVQPGANKTDLQRHMTEDELTAALERVGPLMEASQGALPSLYAATSADAEGGAFYEPDQDNGMRGYPAPGFVDDVAKDETVRIRLWQTAQEITKAFLL
jgi:NAD(P)-dependent dehydrogenase (short-subunit alcohol dehydrogenase family)